MNSTAKRFARRFLAGAVTITAGTEVVGFAEARIKKDHRYRQNFVEAVRKDPEGLVYLLALGGVTAVSAGAIDDLRMTNNKFAKLTKSRILRRLALGASTSLGIWASWLAVDKPSRPALWGNWYAKRAMLEEIFLAMTVGAVFNLLVGVTQAIFKAIVKIAK